MGLTNSETNYNSDESTGSCEGNPSNTDPNTYFKNLDLQLFVEEPLAMLCSFRTFRNECLSTGNPKAHYIEGLLQYFQHDSMEPLTNFDNHDMDSGCEDFYYFKRKEEFVDHIRSKNK
ncbi:unnamed protein product [Brassica oleracea var. botrytis]|uniref:(rape) hypothetical protein n=1 Tax=Brassica napus TaxID=3708 RepID=A0A816RSB0_BRANA|nr:unnamed protein product [Brassica napus]